MVAVTTIDRRLRSYMGVHRVLPIFEGKKVVIIGGTSGMGLD